MSVSKNLSKAVVTEAIPNHVQSLLKRLVFSPENFARQLGKSQATMCSHVYWAIILKSSA